MAEPSLRMLAWGCQNPPETFLDRLFCGLEARGVDVALASHSSPQATELSQRKEWIWIPDVAGSLVAKGAKLTAVTAAAAARDWAGTARAFRRSAEAGVATAEWMNALPLVGRKWDVVYFPWIESAGGLVKHLPPQQKFIVSCRGAQINIAPLNPQRSHLRASLKTIFERAAMVHCVSDEIRENAERLGMPPHKARVIRPAVDPTLFQVAPHAQHSKDSALKLVTTGSIIWRKGMEYLIHGLALARASGIDATLEIIGDGPERARVLYTALDLGIEDHVRIVGALLPTQVRDRLQQADVFVLSSLSEGISNAVLEAMSCGLPVITTDCGGMREAVTDGVEGLVIPKRDARAIADALRKLASSEPLRRRMGEAARQRIEREFTLEQHIDDWMEMLQEVTAENVLAAS